MRVTETICYELDAKLLAQYSESSTIEQQPQEREDENVLTQDSERKQPDPIPDHDEQCQTTVFAHTALLKNIMTCLLPWTAIKSQLPLIPLDNVLPARMWCYGICNPLVLLSRILHSQEHVLNPVRFVYDLAMAFEPLTKCFAI